MNVWSSAPLDKSTYVIRKVTYAWEYRHLKAKSHSRMKILAERNEELGIEKEN